MRKQIRLLLRKAAAKHAIQARWEAYYKANPDKLKAKLAKRPAAGRKKKG